MPENRRRNFMTLVNILSLLLFKKSCQLSYCFLHVTANVSIVLATLENLSRIFHPNFLGVIFPSVWFHSLFNWGSDYLELAWLTYFCPSKHFKTSLICFLWSSAFSNFTVFIACSCNILKRLKRWWIWECFWIS